LFVVDNTRRPLLMAAVVESVAALHILKRRGLRRGHPFDTLSLLSLVLVVEEALQNLKR
jgi:hypothetical protein